MDHHAGTFNWYNFVFLPVRSYRLWLNWFLWKWWQTFFNIIFFLSGWLNNSIICHTCVQNYLFNIIYVCFLDILYFWKSILFRDTSYQWSQFMKPMRNWMPLWTRNMNDNETWMSPTKVITVITVYICGEISFHSCTKQMAVTVLRLLQVEGCVWITHKRLYANTSIILFVISSKIWMSIGQACKQAGSGTHIAVSFYFISDKHCFKKFLGSLLSHTSWLMYLTIFLIKLDTSHVKLLRNMGHKNTQLKGVKLIYTYHTQSSDAVFNMPESWEFVHCFTK